MNVPRYTAPAELIPKTGVWLRRIAHVAHGLLWLHGIAFWCLVVYESFDPPHRGGCVPAGLDTFTFFLMTFAACWITAILFSLLSREWLVCLSTVLCPFFIAMMGALIQGVAEFIRSLFL